MEGYTDCVMAHQHGIANCVAVLGTALGERHLQLLRRYTDSITLVLDGDDAGRRRTNEILDALLALFEKNQVDLRILTLPEGVDPCDFIAQHGSDPFRQLLTQAVDALEHKFNAVTNGLDTLTDTHRASQAAEQLLSTLAKIRPTGGGASSQTLLREEQMLSRMARRFHLPEEKLRSRLSALRREARSRPGAPRTIANAASGESTDESRTSEAPQPFVLPAGDELLLELLLAHPSYFPRIHAAIDEAQIESNFARRVYATWVRLATDDVGPSLSQLLSEFDDPRVKNLLVGIDEQSSEKPPTEPERLLQDVLSTYERRQADLSRRSVLAAARQEPNHAEQLLAQFCEQSKSKHRSDYERRKK
jgi:DNA primase